MAGASDCGYPVALGSVTTSAMIPASRPGISTPSACCCASSAAFAGPEAVLAYLARYTHRVAISNFASFLSTNAA